MERHDMSDENKFSVALTRTTGYQFTVSFDKDQLEPLLLDEPSPLGEDKGPNPSRLVGAAVGDCLSASLLFCLEKAKHSVSGIETRVDGTVRRNERGRWRIAQLDVHISLDVAADQTERVHRCLELFEDYCVVTASVRKGIAVNVVVTDPRGRELYRQDAQGEAV